MTGCLKCDLSDEVGVKQAAAQLGVPYYSLAEWRQKRKAYGDIVSIGVC